MLEFKLKTKEMGIAIKSEGALTEGDTSFISSLIKLFIPDERECLRKLLVTTPSTELVEVEDTTSSSENQKKLVFVKCTTCGETFCKMVDISDNKEAEITCKTCETTMNVSYQTTHKGSYECTCGTKGIFRLTEDVSIIKCKECKELIYMVQDSETFDYEGEVMS